MLSADRLGKRPRSRGRRTFRAAGAAAAPKDVLAQAVETATVLVLVRGALGRLAPCHECPPLECRILGELTTST